ncbi:hypothetical protein HDU87_008093 [Geranomyces variabilis]|uniref:Carboxylic ester hydrolase n=1 Tax=Geranomyces variabilis TaxID=109894 RepID=A0AAD5TP84_9FUNG|nr:hypothetical protein HDU87_008093 [Geranomyces variabilis]
MTEEAPIVTTTSGAVRGTVRSPGLFIWRGIPYAAPPVGPLRFKAPQPVKPWDGVLDTTRFGADAIRSVLGDIKMSVMPESEDCLFLNVWSSGLKGPARPVMVYIHGGAYIDGSGSIPLYNGRHLAQRGDVVVVTINYRLGALGYLYMPSIPSMDSNLGLRDQVFALEWVRDNIAAFGGDPDNVTIFGESAGGNAVTTLLAVPSARGLFARAIAQSPTVTHVWPAELGAAISAEFCAALVAAAAKAKYPTTTTTTASDDVETVLREISAVDIGPFYGSHFRAVAASRPGWSGFSPVVDGTFLPMDPLDATRAGLTADIPLLLGTNRDEAALFYKKNQPCALPVSEAQIEAVFSATASAPRDRVLRAYPTYPSLAARLQFAGDIVFGAATLQLAEARTTTTTTTNTTAKKQQLAAKTYLYRFDYAPLAARILGLGATHGTELPLVFGTTAGAIGKQLYVFSFGRQRALGERMMDAWIGFARTGEPGWAAYEPEKRVTKVWDFVDREVDDLGKDVRTAWGDWRVEGAPAAKL